ncbi:hypothetical protein NM208_g6914 [Fusarium decemcellulare]|uniref:Uncharacterized protein n=1 Tax=Fusarium decemcellulare TaxID=57161 RepID=A0ACC1SBE1_9HYPO|nr:hypothetical protein NM208_g6914 [Fusarium decemcellulare]
MDLSTSTPSNTPQVPFVFLSKYKDPRKVDLELEHIIDKKILRNFFEDSASGKLKSGKTSKYGPLSTTFWDRMDDMDLTAEPGVPKLPGSNYQRSFIMDRAFECLGSTRNDQNFMIVEVDINAAKKNVMQLHRVVEKAKLAELMKKDGKSQKQLWDNAKKIFARIRAGFSAFRYMQLDPTKKKFNNIVKDIRVQFEFAESVYNKKYPDEKVQLADYWIEWLKDYYAHVKTKAKANMLDIVAEMRAEVQGDTGSKAKMIRTVLGSFEKQAINGWEMDIEISGFPTDGDTDMGGT